MMVLVVTKNLLFGSLERPKKPGCLGKKNPGALILFQEALLKNKDPVIFFSKQYLLELN